MAFYKVMIINWVLLIHMSVKYIFFHVIDETDV